MYVKITLRFYFIWMQIHTHMCYSNFNDIIHSIIDMDADVITIENSRSDEKLLSVFRDGVQYGAGIGPGVYDIHSPRIPSTEEMAERARKVNNNACVLPSCHLVEQFWSLEVTLKGMFSILWHGQVAVTNLYPPLYQLICCTEWLSGYNKLSNDHCADGLQNAWCRCLLCWNPRCCGSTLTVGWRPGSMLKLFRLWPTW